MFYLLDKPKGISSFKAIKDFAKENNIKKVGHTGTLDPLATGLLLIATDEDTKLIEYVDQGFKTYVVSLEFGKTSDTYDIEGEIKEVKECNLSKGDIQKAILSFEGKQKQMPPIFSAKKINGKKAYELARGGKEVKLKEAEIEVKEIKNIIFNNKEISFELTVSRGTYIRSIVHDLGKKLECGAIMTKLRRTKIGNLTEKDLNKKISILSLLTLETIKIKEMKNLIDGKKVYINIKDGKYALLYDKDVFGIVKVKDNLIYPIKLIGNKFRKKGF